MATQYSLPFSLSFLVGNEGHKVDVNTFFSEETDLATQRPEVQIRENSALEVLFEADNPDARLYMDGLDMLADRYVEMDQGGSPYLRSASRPQILYKSSDAFYPFIPGFYRLTVTVASQTFATVLEVIPSRISVQQWELMRDELEGEVRGLAQAMIRHNLSVGDDLEHYVPAEHLHRFLVIRKHFPTVMAALTDLAGRVNYRIRTDYQLVALERVKAVDGVTVRHRLTHPDHVSTLMAPVRDVEYNLAENQWVAHIVSAMRVYLGNVVASIESYRTIVETELDEQLAHDAERGRQYESALVRGQRMVLKDLNQFADHAQKMVQSVKMITSSSWYDSVRGVRPSYVPHVLLQDPRYHALYKLYRDLHTESVQVKLDTAFAYQWKRTDLLYELWGFLKLCKAFTQELSFEPVRGWIYDPRVSSSSLFVPVLPPGTCVVVQRDDVRVHLVYNATVPSRASQTNLEVTPMHMPSGFHNRPDSRIDVFWKNIYCGTVLMDFKYRPRSVIWDPSPKPSNRTSATNQLMSYATDSKSPWLLGSYLQPGIREHMRPVIEVWGVYPRHADAVKHEYVEYDTSYNVRLVSLSPGVEQSKFITELENVLKKVLDFASEAGLPVSK